MNDKKTEARAETAAAPALPPLDWQQFSPLTMWRDWIVKSEGSWSDALSQVLKDPATSATLGRQFDEMRMLHRLFGEVAQASLAAAHLPSRADIEGLEERLGRVEDAVAQLSATVQQLRGSLVERGMAAGPAKPKRDRRPASQAAPAAAATTPRARPGAAGRKAARLSPSDVPSQAPSKAAGAARKRGTRR